ncbi:MAG: hypothetical protein NTV03_01260 [Candidatus Nomurabacteria bacterium]|nr:hypothetical protein [Candidatus Nomurabacteria bacterium]
MDQKFNIPSVEKKRQGSMRLWLANESIIKLALGEIKIEGKENIDKIPLNANIVIMSTHLTDLDIPIVIHSIARDLDIAVTNMSVHHKFFGKEGEPSTNIGMRIAGKDNFIPIDYKRDTKGPGNKSAVSFNPNNFETAAESIDKGRAILIAAHKPLPEAKNSLENVKGGYGGVYLSQLRENTYILPVTVVLDKAAGMHGNELDTLKKKPNASVVIGEPFKPEKIPNIEQFSILTKKREGGEILNDEEMKEFSKISHALRNQSENIIQLMSKQIETR